MDDPSQRQALTAVASVWGVLVPVLTTVCTFFVGPVAQRIRLFQPGFPRRIVLAVYTPNEYVQQLCLAGPLGIAAGSVVLGVLILACWRRPTGRSLFMASVALTLNLLFVTSVLSAFALELLRAFPFRDR